ncbi:uncharacterized protein LOC121759421 [Salvia splendens]|uniref:uncharacterized protein LOC121759421 n=1 Tax=Salvia splendens TaxID=180675 RepID=UPI001C269587|nr:uncharacterized protein LOC121759421 [Salvia splendens]
MIFVMNSVFWICVLHIIQSYGLCIYVIGLDWIGLDAFRLYLQVIYVRPGYEADLDSLIQDTVRLATSVKETCEKAEPKLHHIGAMNAPSIDRWNKLLELKKSHELIYRFDEYPIWQRWRCNWHALHHHKSVIDMNDMYNVHVYN